MKRSGEFSPDLFAQKTAGTKRFDLMWQEEELGVAYAEKILYNKEAVQDVQHR